jgi:serine protease Do
VPGKDIEISLFREGKLKSVNLRVGEQPAQGMSEVDSPAEDETPSENLGLQLQTLTPELAKRLGTKQTHGVAISSITPDGIAASSGLQPGDIVLSVNGKKVSTSAEFKSAVDKASLADGIRMFVETQGMTRFVFLKTDE